MEIHTTQNCYGYLNELHRRVSGAIINRINFPKREAKPMTRRTALSAKLRPLLSQWDCEEIRQTVAMVLTSNGAITRDKLTLADWRACFYASRVLLRIDRKLREDATELATLDKVAITVSEPEKFTARRNVIARRARYLHACIWRAFQSDRSRKRKANFRQAFRFLQFLISQAGNAGIGSITIGDCETQTGQRKAAFTFRRYCDTGEKLLEKQSRLDVATREAQFSTTAQGEAKTFRALTFKAKRALIAA